ncbi:hypothetical protein BC830DRAFT_58023 [Chytriomyces sp. MP71]|nr:hypothetical protein BC830DRAFT_58023 [Chytriomyces sp. MP71]
MGVTMVADIEPELKTICFSSFPDSNSTAHSGDTTFSFRFRSGDAISKLYSGTIQSLTCRTMCASSAINLATDNDSSSLQTDKSVIESDAFTYAYTYFRQKPDKEIRRGFFQKSIVFLSPHPFHGAFSLLLESVFGPRLMDTLGNERGDDGTRCEGVLPLGRMLIHEACVDMTRWPPPPSAALAKSLYECQTLQLSFLGRDYACTFPPTPHFPQLYDAHASDAFTSPPRAMLAKVPATLACPGRIYSSFSSSLHLLYPLWELMILGEPILVAAETPKACSQVVWALLELVKPVPYGGDIRPFFTLQDAEFKTLGRSTSAPAATVLGVTNPFFDKLFQHWPHKIRVGTVNPVMAITSNSSSPRATNKTAMAGDGSPPVRPVMGRGMPINPNDSSPQSSSPKNVSMKSFISSLRGSSSNAALLTSKSGAFGGGTPIVVFDACIESLRTKYKPFLSKDKKFMKAVSDAEGNGASEEILNNLVRRQCVDISDRFLQPLNRHYESLVMGSPLSMSLSALRTKPDIKPFQQDSFIESIKMAGPNFPVQSRHAWLNFYRLFLKSANFAAWLQHRSTELNREWRARYVHVLCESDLTAWAAQRGRQEIECVDLLLRYKDEVAAYSKFFKNGLTEGNVFVAAEVTGGFIPSLEQFVKLKRQHDVIQGLLPQSLRIKE